MCWPHLLLPDAFNVGVGKGTSGRCPHVSPHTFGHEWSLPKYIRGRFAGGVRCVESWNKDGPTGNGRNQPQCHRHCALGHQSTATLPKQTHVETRKENEGSITSVRSLPDDCCPANWDNIDDPVNRLDRNSHGHFLACFVWERSLKKYCQETIGRNHSWEC